MESSRPGDRFDLIGEEGPSSSGQRTG